MPLIHIHRSAKDRPSEQRTSKSAPKSVSYDANTLSLPRTATSPQDLKSCMQDLRKEHWQLLQETTKIQKLVSAHDKQSLKEPGEVILSQRSLITKLGETTKEAQDNAREYLEVARSALDVVLENRREQNECQARLHGSDKREADLKAQTQMACCILVVNWILLGVGLIWIAYTRQL